MSERQAGKDLAAGVEIFLGLFWSDKQESSYNLMCSVEKLDELLDAYEVAVSYELRRKPDPRVCEWPKCCTSTPLSSHEEEPILMEAIPEPLVKFALGLLMDMDGYGVPFEDADREHDARLIAAALLAERIATQERCAKIAERWYVNGRSIAAAIRSGKAF